MSRASAFLLLVFLAACDRGTPADGGGSSAAARTTGKTAGIELLGSRPMPPGDLAKLRTGVTPADVKAAFPTAREAEDKHAYDTTLALDSGYSNVRYEVSFDADKLALISVEVPNAFEAQLERIWGPSDHGTWLDKDGWDVGTNKRAQRTILIEYRPIAR